MKTLYLPAENSKDVTELPDAVKKGIKVHLQSHIDEIIRALFPVNALKKAAGKSEKPAKAG